jgi:hypothetical protein
MCKYEHKSAGAHRGSGLDRVTDTWQGCWELNSGPREKRCMLLTTEPPLQPPNSFLMLHSMPLFQWQHFGFSLFIPNVGMNTKHLKNIHEIPRNRTKSLLNFLFVCFLFFRDRVSLGSPGCPGTLSVDQAGPQLRDLSASTSWVLEPEACTKTAQLTAQCSGGIFSVEVPFSQMTRLCHIEIRAARMSRHVEVREQLAGVNSLSTTWGLGNQEQ